MKHKVFLLVLTNKCYVTIKFYLTLNACKDEKKNKKSTQKKKGFKTLFCFHKPESVCRAAAATASGV